MDMAIYVSRWLPCETPDYTRKISDDLPKRLSGLSH